MPKSKLEMYVYVLKIVAQECPSEIIKIPEVLNIGDKELKMCLTFLVKQGLVEKRRLCNCKRIYLITLEGVNVLKHFNELKVLPVI
jgi:predicted transcriptional regulator